MSYNETQRKAAYVLKCKLAKIYINAFHFVFKVWLYKIANNHVKFIMFYFFKRAYDVQSLWNKILVIVFVLNWSVCSNTKYRLLYYFAVFQVVWKFEGYLPAAVIRKDTVPFYHDLYFSVYASNLYRKYLFLNT